MKVDDSLTDREKACFSTGYYSCVAKIDILLELYKSNQHRRYLEMMVTEARNSFTEEEWMEIKRNAYPDILDKGAL